MLVCLTAPQLFASQLISHDGELRGVVESWLTKKTAASGWEPRIRRFQATPVGVLPEGPLEYEVMAPDQWDGIGSASVAVVIRKDGRVIRNVPLRLEVEALADVVVATRQIDHGSVISLSDLSVQKRDLGSAAGRPVRTPADAAGRRARTTFKPGQALRSDQLEKIPLIKSGQAVTIVAENEAIRVTVSGRARGAGAEGDTIMVQNLNSQKEMPARVINATTVQVTF